MRTGLAPTLVLAQFIPTPAEPPSPGVRLTTYTARDVPLRVLPPETVTHTPLCMAASYSSLSP